MKMVYGNGEILFPRGNETTMLGYHDFLRILGSREVFNQTRSLELLGLLISKTCLPVLRQFGLVSVPCNISS